MNGIEALEEMVKTQCSDGNWNYDPYMHGMANGLLLALATIKEEEPEFINAPDVWIYDLTHPDKDGAGCSVSALIDPHY